MNDARFAEMISTIAHELRSPLTTLQGFSATLVDRWDRFSDEQKLQFVTTIRKDAERMGRIISEVLDLARIESNRMEIRPVKADLHRLATDTHRDLSHLDGAERVVIDIDEGFSGWADPDRLRHVFHNLLENAIKFSDDGPITINARTSNDGSVIVVVEDRGVGIPVDRLESVFSGPGPTGQRSTPSGTGLGLYLASSLVEAHGGTLRAESAEGEGSRFTVSLPGSPT